MKTMYTLAAALLAWMTYTKPAEMGVIVKATGHMLAQVIEIGWGLCLAVNFLIIIGWLGLVLAKGTK